MPKIGGVNGLKTKELVKEYSNTVIVINKYLKFDQSEIDFYKEKFNILLDDEIIIDCNYESDIWSGYTISDSKRKIYFDFTLDTCIKDMLKCYVISELYDRDLSYDTVQSRARIIKKMIVETCYYKQDMLEKMKKACNNYKAKSEFVYANLTFLCFMGDDIKSEYIKFLQGVYIEHDRCPRELPDYKSILIFGHLLDKFLLNAEPGLKEKYYPIILWWKITTIIPTRPSEFIRFKRDCHFKNDKGELYLRIPRLKQKPNPLSRRRIIPALDNLRVDKQIIDLIKDFILISQNYGEEFLFALESYARYKKDPATTMKNCNRKDRITLRSFTALLKEFYSEVICNQMGMKLVDNIEELGDKCDGTIVMLKPGDSRHLAFTSMLFQGFNPLIIAQIGGHESLESQLHYHAHLDTFIDAHTKDLTDRIKYALESKSNAVLIPNTRVNSIMRLYNSKRSTEFEPRKIDDGYCWSKEFPKDCAEEDCTDCDFYEFAFDENNKQEIYNRMAKKSEKLDIEIRTQLDFIKRYYKDVSIDDNIDYDKLTYDTSAETSLIRNNNKMAKLCNRKAYIDAYIKYLEENEYENQYE